MSPRAEQTERVTHRADLAFIRGYRYRTLLDNFKAVVEIRLPAKIRPQADPRGGKALSKRSKTRFLARKKPFGAR